MTPKPTELSCKPRKSRTPFTRIIQTGDVAALRKYLGVHLDTELWRADAMGRGFMYDAIVGGNVKIVRELVNSGFDLTRVYGKTGASALHLAAGAGNIKLVRYLVLFMDMDVNATDNNGERPLYYAMRFLMRGGAGHAVSKKHLDVILLLISRGARFYSGLTHWYLEKAMTYLESVLSQQIATHRANVRKHPELEFADLEWINFLADDFADKRMFNPVPEYHLPMLNFDMLKTMPEWQKCKMPAVFGWLQNRWDKKCQSREIVSREDVKPAIGDLAKLCPVLIHRGYAKPRTVQDLITHLVMSVQIQDAPIRQIYIAPITSDIFKRAKYATTPDVAFDMKSAVAKIKEITKLVDERRAMSEQDLAKSNHVVAFIADLNAILAKNKNILGEMQTLAMWGNDVGVHIIAITGEDIYKRGDTNPELSGMAIANFPSRILIFAETQLVKQYFGKAPKSCIGENEAYMESPFWIGAKPIVITMPQTMGSN